MRSVTESIFTRLSSVKVRKLDQKDSDQRQPKMSTGNLAQGWEGESPNEIHLNVLLTHRGSPTAAAITTAFTAPSQGFTPVLVSLGADQKSYVTLRPPTVLLNKSIAFNAFQKVDLRSGTCRGCAGVLDAVAERLLTAERRPSSWFQLWVDPVATDETAARHNVHPATFKAVKEAVEGRSAQE
jgi:formaldehyde-activating enzyme